MCFPRGRSIDDPAAVYSGSLNGRCLRHIAVGATPEQGSQNQAYDKSDVGFARFFLRYGDAVPPHTTITHWLKVPPIHRREPVSMGYIAHAFREVLPGEAVPPFPPDRVAALKAVDPNLAEQRVFDFWNGFLCTGRPIRSARPNPERHLPVAPGDPRDPGCADHRAGGL